jgi:hypothetical protein
VLSVWGEWSLRSGPGAALEDWDERFKRVKTRTLQKAKSAAPAGRDDKANSRSLVGHKAASLGMTA